MFSAHLIIAIDPHIPVQSYTILTGFNQIDECICHCKIKSKLGSVATLVSSNTTIFTGIITAIRAVEQQYQITIHSPLELLQRQQKVRHFNRISGQSILDKILKPLPIEIEYSSKVLQNECISFADNINDYEILARLCQMRSVIFYCEYRDAGCILNVVDSVTSKAQHTLQQNHHSGMQSLQSVYFDKNEIWTFIPQTIHSSGFHLNHPKKLSSQLWKIDQDGLGEWHVHGGADEVMATATSMSRSFLWQKNILIISTNNPVIKITDSIHVNNKIYSVIAVWQDVHCLPRQEYVNRLICLPQVHPYCSLTEATQFISIAQWQQLFQAPVPQTVLAVAHRPRQNQWQAVITQPQVDQLGMYYCQIKHNTEVEFTALPLLPCHAPGKHAAYGMTNTFYKNTVIQLFQTHLGPIILGGFTPCTHNLFELMLPKKQACVLSNTRWMIANDAENQIISLESNNKVTKFLWHSPNDKHSIFSQKSHQQSAESISLQSKKATQHIFGKQIIQAKNRVHYTIKETTEIQCLHDTILTANKSLTISSSVLGFASNGLQCVVDGSWMARSYGDIHWQAGSLHCHTTSIQCTAGGNRLYCHEGTVVLTGTNIHFTAPIILLTATIINPELLALML